MSFGVTSISEALSSLGCCLCISGLDGVQDLQDLPAPPLGAGLLGWVGVAQLRGSGKAAGSRRSSIVHSTEFNGKAFHGGWAMWSRVAQHRSAPRGKHDVEAAASREHRAKKDADFAPARKQDGFWAGSESHSSTTLPRAL